MINAKGTIVKTIMKSDQRPDKILNKTFKDKAISEGLDKEIQSKTKKYLE